MYYVFYVIEVTIDCCGIGILAFQLIDVEFEVHLTAMEMALIRVEIDCHGAGIGVAIDCYGT